MINQLCYGQISKMCGNTELTEVTEYDRNRIDYFKPKKLKTKTKLASLYANNTSLIKSGFKDFLNICLNNNQ